MLDCCIPPLDYEFHAETNKYYKYNEIDVNFKNAAFSCIDDDPKAHLAILKTIEDYEAVMRYNINDMWIGAQNPVSLLRTQCFPLKRPASVRLSEKV